MYRGLLGHNGAGKSTQIDMILGLTNPTDGSVNTFGVSPKQAIKGSAIGAVLQTGRLLPSLTVTETIELIATIFPHPQATAANNNDCASR